MIPLDVKKAMRMNETHALILNSSLSMAHHPTLGIVTMDSIAHKDEPDTSAIADNPPVAGSAGASDPAIAQVVRGIRDRIQSIVSPDRAKRETGQYDDEKLSGHTTPDPHLRTGLASRLAHRKNTAR